MKAILLSDETMRLVADSALLRCNKPLFLEDAACRTLKVCPAVKISRLGFYIKEKFAARYYDSVSAVCVNLPSDCASSPGLAPEICMASDNCLIEGSWLTLESRTSDTRLDYSGNGQSSSVTLGGLQVDRTIEKLSRHMTFKTGDILVFADYGINIPAADAGGAIKTEINGTLCLDFRIK